MSERDRYSRQRVLPQIGDEGQRRLGASTVTLIGCGALGCAQAQLLARAGVGRLRLIDRDFVELGNLHRQVLFDEEDASHRRPKAVAAAGRLGSINSDIVIEPFVLDVTAANVLEVLESSDLVLDATDNVESRYLLNDACVSSSIPWVYGGVTGTEGLVMPIMPGSGPCLRCVFRDPPPPGSLPTCDVAGVLNTGPALVAALQVTAALQLLVGSPPEPALVSIDLWTASFRKIEVRRAPACPCCGTGNFDFLRVQEGSVTTVLCGQDAVQISPARRGPVDLAALALRLRGVVDAKLQDQMLELRVEGRELILFSDGRALVRGTRDPAEARVLYARFVGA